MKAFLSTALICFTLLQACTTTAERDVIRRDGKADVVKVEATDLEVTNAISEARSTVAGFLEALKAPKQSQSEFTVKYPFEEDGTTEHMWVVNLKYDGKVLTGILYNYPNKIRNLSYQQAVELRPDQVSDWTYIEDGQIVGGFTLRALYKNYPEEKRRELEESLGGKIDW